MKKHFITGLIILLPLTLTIFFIGFFFNLLTGPFVGLTKSIFQHFNLFEGGFGIFSAEQVQEAAGKVSIVIFLLFFTIALGAVARWYLINYFLSIWDFLLHRIPFVRSIYKTSQDVISTIFASKTTSFKQVVLVPFPHLNSKSIGFVTRDDLPPIGEGSTEPAMAVFVPTTPNPTSGFLIFLTEKDVIYLDMKVDEAFKYIVSCGVLPTQLNQVTKIDLNPPQAEVPETP